MALYVAEAVTLCGSGRPKRSKNCDGCTLGLIGAEGLPKAPKKGSKGRQKMDAEVPQGTPLVSCEAMFIPFFGFGGCCGTAVRAI